MIRAVLTLSLAAAYLLWSTAFILGHGGRWARTFGPYQYDISDKSRNKVHLITDYEECQKLEQYSTIH
jgi:hypothetical protein